MNEIAALAYLKSTVQAMVWTGGSNHVFHTNSVVVTWGASTDALSKFIMPICLIDPGDETADAENPCLLNKKFSFTIICSVPGDAIGENALLGANRVAVSSQGAGVLQVKEALLDVLSKLNAHDGFVIQHTYSSSGVRGQLNGTTWVDAITLDFMGIINSDGPTT